MRIGFVSRGAARRLLALLVLAGASLLALPGTAYAGTVTFSNHTPIPGSLCTQTQPVISVRAVGTAPLYGAPSLTVRVDGKLEGRVSLVYDRNPDGTLDTLKGVVRCTLRAPLSLGSHAIEVSVMDVTGQRSSTVWSFLVGVPPVLSAPVPEPGATVTTTMPNVSVRATGGVAGLVAVMTVDGVPVPASFDPSTALVTAALPVPLANGATHTVAVSAVNADGLAASLSWGFYVLTQPRMPADTTTGCTSCHASYPAAHPMTNCDACHGYGSPVGGFYTPPDGHYYDWEPVTFLPDCLGCHRAGYVTVPDHGDDVAVHQATTASSACQGCHVLDLLAEHYYRTTTNGCALCHASADTAVAAAIASGDTECATCHPERLLPHGYDPARHQSTVAVDSVSGVAGTATPYGPALCGSCHLTELAPEHGRPSSSSAVSACGACHPTAVDTLTPAWALGCVQGGCHDPAGGQAVHAGMSAAHAHPAANADCTTSGCHDEGDAAAVHASYNPAGGCAYCHSTSAMPTSTACLDCHIGHPDLAVVHTAAEPGGLTWANSGAYAACTQCHYLDLRTEHAKASSGALPCDACHAIGGPVDGLGGPWSGRCQACHTVLHPEYDYEHIAWGQDCGACHGEPLDARDSHYACSATAPGNNAATGSCHTGPDYVPSPRLGAPYANPYWCRGCHPNE